MGTDKQVTGLATGSGSSTLPPPLPSLSPAPVSPTKKKKRKEPERYPNTRSKGKKRKRSDDDGGDRDRHDDKAYQPFDDHNISLVQQATWKYNTSENKADMLMFFAGMGRSRMT